MNKKKINVKLDEKIGEGIYSNIFLITHSGAEFIVDFARLMPGMKDAKVNSRILMTPQHAKQLLNILKKNIENYEKQFGEIKINKKQESEIGFKNN